MMLEYHTVNMDGSQRINYFKIAWQSALAAGLCLGLPAGLLLWLILLREVIHFPLLDWSVAFLQAHGLNKIFVLAACSTLWSFLLGRISSYRPWWKIGWATGVGIIVAWFLPFSNLDAWSREGTPVHIVYAAAMCGIVMSTTLCVGLAYGLILRSLKAALTIALTTTLVSGSALLLTIFLFDQFGIRVGGTVPLAMSKVTGMSLLISAIAGGMTLGVEFSCFAWKRFKISS
jgi:hypothetical protein